MKATTHLWGISLEPESITENELIQKWQGQNPVNTGGGSTFCSSAFGVSSTIWTHSLRINFQPAEQEQVVLHVGDKIDGHTVLPAAQSGDMELCLL